MAVRIENVEKGSPADKAGLQTGMQLISLDGHLVRDGLDYEFYSSPAQICAIVQNDAGKEKKIHISKQEYEPLGCVFNTYLIDKHHSCKNKCVFCFIDQMPKGMRKSLYFKDDDERLSFLFGNYVTLTNLTEQEVERIIEMRISPINISVHTANPELRVAMMKNKNAGKVLDFIPKLAAAGISLNTQLVLCPGINDGAELRRSIEWLTGFYPAIQSIAAVPVGLTKYREGLADLQSYSAEAAAEQLAIMLEYGDAFSEKYGQRLVYPSDEWFLLAGKPIPQEDFYDGYLQLENGVGMWRSLYDEFMQALDEVEAPVEKAEADVVVGMLAAPLLQELAENLHQKYPHVTLHVHPIQNDFFGHGVTVTGLLTGQDIIAQLRGKTKSNLLLLPEVVLRSEGDVMLDETTPEEVAEALDMYIEIVPSGGENLLCAVLDAVVE